MRTKLFFLILSLFLLVQIIPHPTLASGAISAHHAILIDGDSGEVLFEKDAHTRVPMASTTKIMTALAVLDVFGDDAASLRQLADALLHRDH